VTYPNVLVADYVKKARVASPQVLAKAEQYIHLGYQRLLTFEVSGGGFDWCGHGPAVIWLTAYGVQEFNDMAKVHPIDPNVIKRTQAWLMKQQAGDGTWSDNHGARWLPAMGDQKLLLTGYVAWSLLDTGVKDKRLDKSIAYIIDHLDDAKDNAYILALTANALAAWNPKHPKTLDVLAMLGKLKKDVPEWQACCYPATGQSLAYSRGESATIETTALAVLAMLKTEGYNSEVNQALTYLVKSKNSSGTWGSTQATILSLKALVAGMGGVKQEGNTTFTILVNGQEAAKGEVTPLTSDVMQLFDLKEHARIGKNEVAIQVDGKTNMMYQIVGRHYESRDQAPAADKPALDIVVDYDRTELSTADVIKAKATLRYNGSQPTYMVIVDLAVPPGFAADAADFARIVRKGEGDNSPVEKFTMTPRQVTLYLGNVRAGDVLTFDYTLKPRFPVKVQTPASVAYEYYTPANRATSKPIELTVRDRDGKLGAD
jgi:hypothetical protein